MANKGGPMKMNFLKIGFVVLSIIAGLYALFAISPTTEIALGFFTLTIGLLAIFWTASAYRNLSPNSALRSYTGLFLASLNFILANSVWSTIMILFELDGFFNYIGYVFSSAAYVSFVIAAYKILKIGEEFGFRDKAQEISKALKSSRRVRK